MRSKALLFSNIYSTILVSVLNFYLWLEYEAGEIILEFLEMPFELYYFDEWLEYFFAYLPLIICIFILPLLGLIFGWLAYERQSSKLAFASAIMYIFVSNLFSYDLGGWGWLLGSLWLFLAFIGYYKQKELEK